jgi:hypothetical protein
LLWRWPKMVNLKKRLKNEIIFLEKREKRKEKKCLDEGKAFSMTGGYAE